MLCGKSLVLRFFDNPQQRDDWRCKSRRTQSLPDGRTLRKRVKTFQAAKSHPVPMGSNRCGNTCYVDALRSIQRASASRNLRMKSRVESSIRAPLSSNIAAALPM